MRRNIKLAEAPSYGKTIFEYEPRCNGAEDYKTVAEYIHSQTGAEVPLGTEEALKGQTIKGVKEQAEAVVVGEDNEGRAQPGISKQPAMPIQEVAPEKKAVTAGEVPSGTNDHV